MNDHVHHFARNGLCRSFTALGQWTWQSMQDATQYALPIGEESITDFALLFLRQQSPSSVFIRKFTRRQEWRTGADWEWWFTDGARWFGMLVQAKRLNPTQQKYENLLRGKKSNHANQVNALIRRAGAQHPPLYPAYCFYNWLPGVDPNEQVCQCKDGANLLGFTIADAYCIKRMILNGTNQYRDVARVARPIHCLVCCPLHDSDSIAESARDKVRDLRKLGQLSRLRPRSIPETTQDVPDYVRSVSMEQEFGLEPTAPPKPGLAGVIVVSQPLG